MSKGIYSATMKKEDIESMFNGMKVIPYNEDCGGMDFTITKVSAYSTGEGAYVEVTGPFGYSKDFDGKMKTMHGELHLYRDDSWIIDMDMTPTMFRSEDVNNG